MDFSLHAYDRLIGTVAASGYHALTLRQALTGGEVEYPFIVRHDVEWELKRTLAVTDIEKRHDIRSSLYFRVDTRVFDVPVMLRLQNEGFEIGYHFNTLDRCRGDFDRATVMFEEDVRRLREVGLDIRSVIPHGDPRIKKAGYSGNGDILISDRNLLARNNLLDLDSGLAVRYPQHTYIRDLGIRWNLARSGRELIEYVKGRRWPAIYMLTHPDYWSGSLLRACGLQIAAHALRVTGLNRKIATVRSLWTANGADPAGSL